MLFDVELLAPEVVHVIHHGVEHGEEEEQEIEPEDAGEVKGEVRGVRESDGEAFRLLKVGDVSQRDHALADEASGVEWDPSGVPVV